MERYTAFDFETASGKNPCSIGIVEFDKGEVISSYYSLINPEIEKFNPFTIKIHGISEMDVINEKNFGEIWNNIKHYFDNRNVVAHNSSFDISVLQYSLSRYNLSYPDFNCFCTMRIAKRFLGLNNYKLSTVARYYGINQENYHNSLEDAKVCGEVFSNLINQFDDIKEYRNSNTSNVKKLKVENIPNKLSFSVSKVDSYNKRKEISGKLGSTSSILADKVIVISGVFENVSRDELKKLIEDNGGKVGSSISSKTSYLVAGDRMGPSKRTKAESVGVPIISENDFMEMLQ